MNLIRLLLFFYILFTPVLFFILVYLSVRTRNILLERVWLRRYFLPSFILFILMVVNLGLLERFYPSVLGEIHVSCVSYGDVEADINNASTMDFVALLELKQLNHIEQANVFDPEIVGYVNHQYYAYTLMDTYKNSLDSQGLLRVSENQPAFLMDSFPCAVMDKGDILTSGVYLIVGDQRALPFTYQDRWYEEAYTLFSYQKITNYDTSTSFDLQSEDVKNQVQRLTDLLNE